MAPGVEELQLKMLKVLHIVQPSWLLNHIEVRDFSKKGGGGRPQTLQQGYQRTSGSLDPRVARCVLYCAGTCPERGPASDWPTHVLVNAPNDTSPFMQCF